MADSLLAVEEVTTVSALNFCISDLRSDNSFRISSTFAVSCPTERISAR